MNPFIFGRVVSGDNFYDRKEETERIFSTLIGGNNLVLYAPRRYGKTSLVFKVMEQLEKSGFVPIYIDIMMTYSLDSFIQSYYSAIMQKQGNLSKVAREINSIAKSFRPNITFDDSGKPQINLELKATSSNSMKLEEILDIPEALANNKKRYIIVMDEFQEVTKFKDIDFEKVLRSKIQHHKNVNYLFLGSKTHLLQEMFSNKSRAFYNSALTMQIEKLPYKDSIDFLIQKFKGNDIELSEKNALYLIDSADNIPYYIQLISSEVWQMLITNKSEITTEHIDSAVKRIIDLKSDYYFSLFDNMSLSQKILINTLIKENKNIYSAEFIKKHNLPASSTIQRSISSLIENGIIERIRDEYIFVDPFFRKYLIRYV